MVAIGPRGFNWLLTGIPTMNKEFSLHTRELKRTARLGLEYVVKVTPTSIINTSHLDHMIWFTLEQQMMIMEVII